MNMKRKLDESRFKKLLFEIGCFMDLYNLIIENKENGGEIISRFLTYFYYFNEQSFLLSMRHCTNGDGLLDISKNSRDNLHVHKALSKYIQENETFNEKFKEYGSYFNERSDVLRVKLGQVNLFCFVLSSKMFGFGWSCDYYCCFCCWFVFLDKENRTLQFMGIPT